MSTSTLASPALAPARPKPAGWIQVLRGDVGEMDRWVHEQGWGRFIGGVGVIALGAGLFGAATGSWRSAGQAVFTGIKFPLIMLLTMAGNGLLNGMLAPLLGLNLNFRQALVAVLMSFTVTAVLLGSLSPLMAFLVWNTPPMGTSATAYRVVLLTQVAAIALAGLAGNARLLQFLEHHSERPAVARRVFLAWLAVNLFLGAQLSWNLRPFIGSPGLPVEFLRSNAFEGNFYEAVFLTARGFLHH